MHTSRLATRQGGKDTSPLDTMSDHCFQFKTQWEKMRENEIDVLTFIWHVYFYHNNRGLDIPMKLKMWAISIAQPYLLNNLPSALTHDISDPRNA